MVIGPPRSGTTWASVWLSTHATHCLHDPLFEYRHTELDRIRSGKALGISCTGVAMFPDWLANHPARKVILHRDIVEVNVSLGRIGLPLMPLHWDDRLWDIPGHHYPWTALFDDPRGIYEHLTGLEFDAERHSVLRMARIEPDLSRIRINAAHIQQVMADARVH